jgi:hypothetical protein
LISLDDPARWAKLQHAYGPASDTPALLKKLYGLPAASESDAEPWYSLCSSLTHQGDVYSATYAAVPHVIEALSTDPAKADEAYFDFPAWVEICRQKKNLEVPDELRASYFAALSRLPSLVAQAADRPWSDSFLLSALSAISAAKGNTAVAEVVLELVPDVARDLMEWFWNRQ